MRVLFWTLTFWPNIGGMEVHAARLLPRLRARGHEFLVVAPQNFTDLPTHDSFDGIPVRRLPFQHAVGSSIDHIAAVRADVIALKRAFAADLVHVNGLGAMDFFHLTTARVNPAPLLATLHGDWGARGDAVAGQTLRAADWVVGCSTAILERARRIAPAIGFRSSVIPNAIETAGTPDIVHVTAPRVLYIGRLADEKGPDVAIEAFAQVKRRIPDARLTVAGEGPMRADLERRARELGIHASIDFIGWVLPDRVMNVVNEHALLIMPSRQDSFPLVALEAGAMARPVVATRVGGLPEIVVPGETGMLVEADDAAALAGATAALLADPQASQRMGASARRRVEALFSWEGHVAGYDALYRSLSTASGRARVAATA